MRRQSSWIRSGVNTSSQWSTLLLGELPHLHNMEVIYPPQYMVGHEFVSGEPYVRALKHVILGDSGAHIYGSSEKYYHIPGTHMFTISARLVLIRGDD